MKERIKNIIGLCMRDFVFFCIPMQKNQIMPYDQAEKTLNAHAKDPGSSCLRNNQVNEKLFDLSIIVPVYNVEDYLYQCLNSIFNQKTSCSYEVIVVNDGSTDNSAAILNEFGAKENYFLLQQENQGLSGARNSGLQFVRGRYIMFVDSDDYLPENTVESLMSAAEHYQADIVQGGYYSVSQKGNEYRTMAAYETKGSVPPNGVVSGMAWGKVYKSELFEGICFPEDYWYEDTITTSILTHLAKRVSTISDMVYYYRQNSAGITKMSVGKPKSIDTFYVLRSVMNARRTLGMQTDQAFYEHLLRLIILSYKRTKHEPDNVKRSMFSLFHKMLEEERAGKEFVLHGSMKRLDETILTGDYRRYCFLCSLP